MYFLYSKVKGLCQLSGIIIETIKVQKCKPTIMHTEKTEMTTLTTVLEKLRVKKQDNEFSITPKGFTTVNSKIYQPQDLKIIKIYRFEGETDPSDSLILYVIEANDGMIGYSMDAYGAYSNHENDGYDEFIKKLIVEERDEQLIFN